MIRKVMILALSFLFVCTTTSFASARTLKLGMEGSDVKEIQVKLQVSPTTGYFGSLTKSAVVSFQNTHQLTPDGIVGPLTLAKILGNASSSSSSPSLPSSTTLKQGMENDSVKQLQTKLKSLGYLQAAPTGYFGSLTKTAVLAFQKDKKLSADGIAGPLTLAALSNSSLSKPYTIGIDPGHGGNDVGSIAADKTYEKTLTLQYSDALKTELINRGYKVVYSRSTDTACFPGAASVSTELQCRINKLENNGAHLLISVHMNASSESSARGTETYYYGNGKGKTLATNIHATTKSSIGSLNRGVMEKNLYMLRYSSIPAALIEVGFISNASDLSKIKNNSIRAQYISDVADGIDDYYGY